MQTEGTTTPNGPIGVKSNNVSINQIRNGFIVACGYGALGQFAFITIDEALEKAKDLLAPAEKIAE